MRINFGKTGEFHAYAEGVKGSLYAKMHGAAEKSEWIRGAGLLVAGASAVITLAAAISLVVEPLFKGIVNVCGSPFHRRCCFTTGIGQLTQVPFWLVAMAVYIPLYLVTAPILTTVFFVIDPEEYTRKQAAVHGG